MDKLILGVRSNGEIVVYAINPRELRAVAGNVELENGIIQRIARTIMDANVNIYTFAEMRVIERSELPADYSTRQAWRWNTAAGRIVIDPKDWHKPVPHNPTIEERIATLEAKLARP